MGRLGSNTDKEKLLKFFMGTRQIHIKGIVQGVGFRPFVYTAAKEYHISGWVKNSSAGVEIVASGSSSNLDSFIRQIKQNPPPLSKIDHLDWTIIETQQFSNFVILKSEVIPGEFIPISPDVAICPDCERELFDPDDARYRYPFINCTNCGPRLTIIKDIPYDRPNTTMHSFPMCSFCNQEYDDPGNRRFHAQPIACPNCGPQIWFQDINGNKVDGESGLEAARAILKKGKILAIKGLGGFHLACDALNQRSLTTLRMRKKRFEKPFAVMAFDINTVEKYCRVNQQQKELIQSHEKPIVIVDQKLVARLPEQLAPGRHTIGVMLPYTPLHLLLLKSENGFPDIFVMTSGNISDEPIAFTNEDAIEKLDNIADGFLLHDRDINTRVDDSVTTEVDGKSYFFRRSRGYAPKPIIVGNNDCEILAVGAELKNTFCLNKKNYGFISHHIGDLKNFETYRAFVEGIENFQKLFKVSPDLIVCDLHPDYLSTKFAENLAREKNLPLLHVQHHHAHLAACLADNEWDCDAPVIGIIFDGTGYGMDGNIWGGEILVGNCKDFERKYHLENMPLPGGDKAVQNPNRIASAYLHHNNIPWDQSIPAIRSLIKDEKYILKKQIESGVNTPFTSSMGRLFDAVASLSGLRHHISYEAQAAIELEQEINSFQKDAYHFMISKSSIRIENLLKEIIKDIENQITIADIAAKFHNGIVNLVRDICVKIRDERRLDTVALSGGVWQNLHLLKRTMEILRSEGFTVLIHHNVPANDGGISLGQIAIAQANRQK